MLGQVAAGIIEVDLDLGLVGGRALLLYGIRKGCTSHYPNNQSGGGGYQQPGPVAPFGQPDRQGCCAY
ncbi:MAG TPA: hypothetical protein VMS00_00510, partial [Acidimicrobiales bacterium]|nr:hypothetical protein [Acidimicrobiales bacterium]